MKKRNQKQVLMCNGKSVVLINSTEHLKDHTGSEARMVELTDTELQAVTGGGSKPGIASGSN
jgi:bacteriocin-like protein